MSTTATREQIEARVFEALEEFGAEPDQISADAEFEALDIDSLDLAELSQIVDEEFGVVLKGSDMADVKTVGDALDLIVARAS